MKLAFFKYNLFITLLLSFFFIKEAKAGDPCTATSITIGTDVNDCAANSVNYTDDNVNSGVTPMGCGTTDRDDWWGTFTGNGNLVRIKVHGKSSTYIVANVYEGTCGSMSYLDCDYQQDDEVNNTIDILTTNGATYFVRVSRTISNTLGTGQVCVYNTTGTPYFSNCDPILGMPSGHSSNPVSITVGEEADCAINSVDVDVQVESEITPEACGGGTTRDDWWGTFVATDTLTTIRLYGVNTRNSVVAIYSGPCMAAMTLIDCSNTDEAETKDYIDDVPTVIGETYYIRAQRKNSSSGLGPNAKVCVYNSPYHPTQPACDNNMSFESGNLDTWQGFLGNVDDACDNSLCWPTPGLNIGAINEPLNTNAQHSLMTGKGRDINTGNVVRVTAPGGGNFSLRLGNEQVGRRAEKVYHSFVVTPATRGFTYQYAVVLENPSGHPPEDQPRFVARLLDASGALITMVDSTNNDSVVCGDFEVVSQPGLPGWENSVADNGIWFKDWTTVAFDLIDFMGQTLTMEFSTGDCGQGAHFGYAYVDMYCVDLEIAGKEICAGDLTTTLTAPSGFASYTWAHSGETTQSVVINNPQVGDVYCVQETTFSGCPARWLCDTIIGVEAVAGGDVTICVGESTQLTASGGTSYRWSPILGLDNPNIANPTATPNVSTQYIVEVMGANGCTSQDTVQITVNPLPATAPTTMNLCDDGTGQATFDLTSVDGIVDGGAGNTVTWYSDPATTTAIGTPTAHTTGSTTVYASVTDGTCTDTTSVYLIVDPLPVANPTTIELCDDGTGQATFDLTSVDGIVDGGAGNTVTWYSDPATTTAIGTPAAHTTGSTTVYASVTDGTCTDTTSVYLVVNPLPTVIATIDTAICIGASATVNASGAATYVWDNGLPATAGPHTVTPTVTTTYTVTGTDVNGCVNDSSVTITVNPLPTITTADEAVCWEDSVQICAAGGNTYTWVALDGGLFDAGTTGACVYVEGDQTAPGADYTRQYEVTGTDVNGCVNTDTATVTYEAICGPSITATGDTICVNEPSANLTSNISNTTGVVTYAWTPATNLDDPTSPNPVFTPTVDGTFTYTVTITDDLGTDTDSTIIIVHPLPTVIATIDTAICIGASATVNASGAATYVWDNGLPATAGPHTVTPTVTTTYTVTGTDVNGCVNDSSVTITVNPLPIITAPDETVCKDDPITVTANGGVSYTWVSIDGGLINAGSTTPTVEVQTDDPGATADITRRYEVTGTDANGCVSRDTSTVTYEAICGPTVRATGDTICINEPAAQLTSEITFTTGVVTYAWTPAANLDDPTSPNPIATGLTDTTLFQVIITDDLGSDTDQVAIYVNPLPVVIAATDTAICIGASANITASGANTYVWDNGLPATAGPHTVSPTITTTYTVTGTDANGCVNDSTVTVTVNPLPVVVAVTDTAICIGENVDITASGALTYVWDNGPTTAIQNVAPTSTTTYTVTGTDANGCVDTDNVTVTVNPLPVPNAGIDQTICLGDNATITATSTGATPIVYTWGQTPPTTGAGPHVLSPVVTTTYTLTVTDNNGCTNTDDVVINVNPLPIPDAGMDQNICIGESTSVTTTVSNGTGPYIYVWDNGLPATAGPHIVTPPVGTHVYPITVTDFHGCVGTDTTRVIVNPNPIIDAGLDTTICIGESVSLNGTGGATYEWKDLSNGVVFSVNPTVVVQPVISTCYEVTGTDVNGCVNIDTVCVEVEEIPDPSFLATNPCAGSPTDFINNTVGDFFYEWDFGDNSPISNDISPTHLYNGVGDYTVKLIATSQLGCVDSITEIVNVKYMPNPSFIGDTIEGCPPVTTSFTNLTDSIDPNFTYLWEFGDGSFSNSNDSVIYHTYPDIGSYTVKLTVTSNGCTAVHERINYVTVHPVPETHFTAIPSITDIYDPTIHFTDLSIGSPDLWSWDFGDNTGSDDQHPIHMYTDTGTFTVWLKIENQYGCTDSASKPVKIIDVFTFFAPNAFTPDGDGVNDIFLPQGHAIDLDHYTLYIFDRWGELIYETHDYYEGWNGTLNGTLVQIDTYVWKVDLKDIFGEGHKYIGRVSVVR